MLSHRSRHGWDKFCSLHAAATHSPQLTCALNDCEVLADDVAFAQHQGGAAKVKAEDRKRGWISDMDSDTSSDTDDEPRSSLDDELWRQRSVTATKVSAHLDQLIHDRLNNMRRFEMTEQRIVRLEACIGELTMMMIQMQHK